MILLMIFEIASSQGVHQTITVPKSHPGSYEPQQFNLVQSANLYVAHIHA